MCAYMSLCVHALSSFGNTCVYWHICIFTCTCVPMQVSCNCVSMYFYRPCVTVFLCVPMHVICACMSFHVPVHDPCVCMCVSIYALHVSCVCMCISACACAHVYLMHLCIFHSLCHAAEVSLQVQLLSRAQKQRLWDFHPAMPSRISQPCCCFLQILRPGSAPGERKVMPPRG